MIIQGRKLTSSLGLLAATATVVSLVGACQQPSPPPFGYSASAYGSYATAAGEVNSAASFPAGIGCTTTPGLHSSNTGASTTVPGFGQTGTVTSTGSTVGGITQASLSGENVSGVNLLGGLIRATTIKVSSRTTHNAHGFGTAATTAFTGLNVAGTAAGSTVAPNTVIALSGLGTVKVNEQARDVEPREASQFTAALDVNITHANDLGLPVGARLLVGVASTQLNGIIVGLLDGTAYGTTLTGTGAGAGANSGPTTLLNLPCLGTAGKTVTASAASASLPNVARVGKVVTTGRGVIDPGASNAEMTSTVSGVNVLSSLVSASTIKADAHSGAVGTTKLFYDTGSELTNVRVAGHGLLATVAPNTTIVIPGVGTLYLHRVIRTATSIEVRMIELVITTPNHGLTVGTDLKIAVAEASAH